MSFKTFILAIASAFYLCVAPAAAESFVFDFSYKGNGIDVFGTLDTLLVGNGRYLVTDISGQFDELAGNGATYIFPIAGLAPPWSYPGGGGVGVNDNILIPNNCYTRVDSCLTYGGLSYYINAYSHLFQLDVYTAWTGRLGNPLYGESGYPDPPNCNGCQFGFVFTVSPVVPSAVPEPSTWVMLLIGFAGLGFASYQRTVSARRLRRAGLVSQKGWP